jgi:anthranilate synthase/aminodeoxychorismate synthase-like glutamine amidotransferase
VILVVDNHDSFTWNLVHALARSGRQIRVVESDQVTVDDVLALSPAGVVLSPGPGRPEDAGVSLALVRRLSGQIPLFGVCLGQQVICAAYGARVVHAKRLMHGRTSRVRHDGQGLFAGLPNPLEVARYHSLVVEASSLPEALIASAFTEEGELMAVRHREHDVCAVQFHPESFMTEHGVALVERWTSTLSRKEPPVRGAANLGIHV